MCVLQVRNRLARPLTIMLVLAAVICAIPLTAHASAGHTSRVARCGSVRASVPYSRHGHRYRWGVYVDGSASCRRAELTLDAVMHLHAAQHIGSDNADSYFTYRGWRCDFGQMGFQSCWTPSRRPYRAEALALACDKRLSTSGCPASVPRDYLP